MNDTRPAARPISLDLLETVLRRKRPLDDAMAAHGGFSGLDDRDRAFVRMLVATVLRRLGQIDALIDHALERPLPKNAAGVRDLLRLGICQLLFLGTPPHAAVSTAVDLAQTRGHGPHKRLVNAVLRRMGRDGPSLIKDHDWARLNTPGWLWDAWTGAYGEPTCRRIAEAHLSEAPLDITVKADAGAWAEKLDARLLETGTLRRDPGGRIEALPGFEDGAWWIQDAAAALPATFLGDVSGRRVIDLCAAPGGKTAQLASRGARVSAIDRSERRLARLRENLGRLGLEADLIAADAATWRPPEPADAVLLDAPCSATGTIRRRPDVAWLKTADDVAKLAQVQDRLLTAAVEIARPGAVIVYCACSLQPEEGEHRIAALSQKGLPVTHVPLTPDDVGGITELVSPDGNLRSLPCHFGDNGGIDGFFASRFRRL